MSQAVGEERRSARYAEDREIGGAGGDGATGEIGDEETDDEAISKPHPEEFGHGGRSTGKHGQRAYGGLLEFFYRGGGRSFFFGGTKGEIKDAPSDTWPAGGDESVFLLWLLCTPL